MLARNGVELDVVADRPGDRLNSAVWQLNLLARDEPFGIWDDLLGSAKALRWRRLTQPRPVDHDFPTESGAADTLDEISRLRGAVGVSAQRMLDELAEATKALTLDDSAVGPALLGLLEEATPEDCVVIAANGAAAAGLENWLRPIGFEVKTAVQMIREQRFIGAGYAVGPPRVFPASMTSAPMVETLNYVFPSWFTDRSLPRSVLASRAEGVITIRSRVFEIGEETEAIVATIDRIDESDLLPQASWIPPDTSPREPGKDEVAARIVLLSGGYRIWLDDDGERIRAVEPTQPGGERVINIDISAVRPGTYLLLREGETEREALYDAALALMGSQADAVTVSQARWKAELQLRLDKLGHAQAVQELSSVGVKTLERVSAWTMPMLARPRSNQDFEKLLLWLDIDVQPTYDLATTLRRKRAQASAIIGDQLEGAVAAADMSQLERSGNLRLKVKSEGFRGVIATRVLSISPHVVIVPHRDARQLSSDRSARWLE